MPRKAATKEEGAKKAPTLKEVFNLTCKFRWKGTKGERTAVLNAEDSCEIIGWDRPVDTITTEDIDELVIELEDRGLSLATINKKISALSTVLHTAVERGYINRKPKMHFRKVTNGRIRWVTEEEEQTILYLCDQWGLSNYGEFFVVALDTGMREGEMLRLEVRDYNPETRMVHTWETKNENPRSIPATQRVHDIFVKRMKDKAPTARMFDDMDKWKLINVWRKIRRHMKLDDDKQFVIHTLRHTCASRLAMDGVPLIMIQKYLGHKAIQTTLRYAHLCPESLGQARDALEARQKRLSQVITNDSQVITNDSQVASVA